MRRLSWVLAAALLIAVGCSGSQSGGGGPTTSGQIKIDSPAPGSVVTSATIEVTGTAPAGSRIVRDVSFGPDQDVIAGTDGRWTIVVRLDEGPNELVFRIGGDRSTAVSLGVTYRPSTAVATPDAAEPTDSGSASATPTPEPAPTKTFRTFEDGTWEVGSEIKPGTYRLRDPATFCYWARLKGFSGELKDIIANENVFDGYAAVTIKSSDTGFESSNCGGWSSDLSQVTASKSRIDLNGTYIVGTDISAGKWRSSGGGYCYWARLDAFTGQLGAIIANDNVFGGRTIVTIRKTDKGFATSGCGTWTRQ